MRELVERAQRGDHDAYAMLVTAQADRLYAVAYLLTGDRGSAEDAVQDACIEAWRDLPRLRAADRFNAWLRRIVVHACLDDLRRRRRRPREIRIDPHHHPASADHAPAVAQADALAHAFARLSHQHRTVIVLSHFDGQSTAEIAATLGLPVGTVKSRLHHALRAMRAALDADARLPTTARGKIA